jgi:3',5'-cyclic AMP phosphodiesterase CpdA
MKRALFVIARSWMLLLVLIAGSATQAGAEREIFSFAVTADSRGIDPELPVNAPVLARLFNDMNTFKPEFCLFPGDLVFGGFVDNQEFMCQLEIWKNAASNFKQPLYPTPGNHEMRHWADRDEAWNQMFPGLPHNGPAEGPKAGNYYFDYHGSRFISVLSDHEDWHVGIDQKWLDQVLDASMDFKHIFVMSHHPMQQLGGAKGEFWQSLRRHRVEAYFCGHWHLYNRSQPEGTGPWQIILGTAGAPTPPAVPTWFMNGTTEYGKYGFAIVKVNDSFVEVTFYSNTEGQEKYTRTIDHFIISNSEPRQGTENMKHNTYSELKDAIVTLLTRPSTGNLPPTAERRYGQ